MKTHKQMTNQEIAELLRSVAAAYAMKGKNEGINRFRIAAYQKAADGIEHASSELKDLWEQGKLNEVPGIGASLSEYLDELFRTGKVKHFSRAFKGLPEGMFSLLKIPGIGPRTAFKLTKELGIKDINGLKRAAKSGKIRDLEGFGEGSEADILKSIKEVKERSGRMLLPYASSIAEDVVSWLNKSPSVARVDPLGSLRRQVATVGDVDIAVASSKPKDVIEHFVKYPKRSRVLEAGDRTSSILLPGGAQVDLMIQSGDAYGALLQHFTGSKHHNIALREYALKQGKSLSEYGIKTKIKSEELKMQNYNLKLKIYQFPTEKSFYEALGLEFILPELRENTGEIEAARTGKLPHLVKLEDIKGDFHLHSDFNIKTSHDQGSASFNQMLELGEELGYEYIGFSEHNPAQSISSEKQMIELLERKKEAIEQINYSREKKREKRVKHVFNGLEIDILPTGKLAAPNKGLELLDYAIVAVHSSFRQNKKEQTKRVLSGLAHPKAKILGHPTARRLNAREEIELDWDQIFDFCQKNDKWLEINSWFDRLDLPDTLVRQAVKKGVKMVINTDSHQLDHMRLMRYGVSVARRGWAEKRNIINTLSFNDFLKEFTSNL